MLSLKKNPADLIIWIFEVERKNDIMVSDGIAE